ncbi:MAG: SDR family NAD(P)-dependent oxidoreductase [Demequinaceae bacterium]|nr:SDR family NAD(P)-dependent oxidoreductase [Demequinaceae bacterium]
MRREDVEVRAASRSSETRFDWAQPDTWKPALAGMRSVYIVPEGCPDVATMEAFCQAAVEEGLAQLVLLSTREAEYDGYESFLEIEDAIIDAGTGWTILRPSWFSQNFHSHYDKEIRAGLLELPAGEGRDPFIDADDVAEVAFQALTMHGHDEKVYELSGPDPLSFREATERISALTGLTVRYQPITEEAYLERLKSLGSPDDVARLHASAYRPIAKGDNDYTSEGFRRLLGHSPRDFDTFVKEAVQKGIWPPP